MITKVLTQNFRTPDYDLNFLIFREFLENSAFVTIYIKE